MQHPYAVHRELLDVDEPSDLARTVADLEAKGLPADVLAPIRRRAALSPERRREVNRARRVEFEEARLERFELLVGRFRWPRARLLAAIGPGFDGELPAFARLERALDRRSVSAADVHRRLVILSGPTGSGKTTAAVRYLWGCGGRRWVEEGVVTVARDGGLGVFVKSSDLVAASLTPPRPGQFVKVSEVIECAPLVVVDDYGAETIPDDRVVAYFNRFVDLRYDDPGALTILTTNLDMEACAARFGPRAWRRIEEVGRFVPLSRADVVRPGAAA